MRQKSIVSASAAFVIILVLDQLSKWAILRELGPGASSDEIELIPGVLRFIFVRNTGSAFGLFQGSSEILKVVAIVAILALAAYYARAAARDWVLALALGLQLGGAIGNVIDRFRYGYVVDFINVPRWPTFNIADSAITVGVALLMYALLFRDPDRDTTTEVATDMARPSASSQPRSEDV